MLAPPPLQRAKSPVIDDTLWAKDTAQRRREGRKPAALSGLFWVDKLWGDGEERTVLMTREAKNGNAAEKGKSSLSPLPVLPQPYHLLAVICHYLALSPSLDKLGTVFTASHLA